MVMKNCFKDNGHFCCVSVQYLLSLLLCFFSCTLFVLFLCVIIFVLLCLLDVFNIKGLFS